MARTKSDPVAPVYSIVIVHDGNVMIERNLEEGACKAKLASIEREGAADAYVFAGPEVKWGTEIALYAEDAPTQQPAHTPKRKYTKRKPAEVKGEPPKGANGAGEKNEERAS